MLGGPTGKGSVDAFAGRVRRAYILGSEEPPPLDL
jgi:hypothetical protein